MHKRYECLIGAGWRQASTGEESPILDPSTGREWGSIPSCGPREVDEAVLAAASARRGDWAITSGSRRAHLLRTLADRLDERAEDIARTETRDNGKLLRETLTQSRFAASCYRYYAGVADKVLGGEVIPLDNPGVVDYLVREPVGVCALLIPWNSPMQLLANKLAPALAAGNCVVIKPSEHASASILEFGKLVQEAGFPPGVVNIVTGGGSSVGTALVAHPNIDLVSFTGGVATGQSVMHSATNNLAHLVLELGGKSPNIVFDDADMDRALDGVVAGIFAAAGQTCVAGSRLLLQASIYDAFLGELIERAKRIIVGLPTAPSSEMGPVANLPQYERVLDLIAQGRADGGTVVCGGEPAKVSGAPNGFYVQPTVFANVTNNSLIAREEVFGPVLSVLRFETETEAVDLANDSPFGLSSGVWTRGLARALRVGRALRAGTVWINTYRTIAPGAPFGGVKRSGIGRERGMLGLLEYTQAKNVMIDISDERRDPFAIRT